MKISQKKQDMCEKIGAYYLIKNKHDYNKACEDIVNLRIRDIEIVNEVVIIWTERPGLLIGKRGENIAGLEEVLKKKIHIIEAQSAYPLEQYLLPEDPSDYSLDWEEEYRHEVYPDDDWFETPF